MQSINVKAPAKVNTILRVLGRRPNGYHDLQMAMVPLSLHDEIELSAIPSGIELSIDGTSDEGMCGPRNLAWRAADLMIRESGHEGGVRIALTKHVPVAAGLGGGSSDAAAVLRGLNELWNLGWAPRRLAELGKGLGADVPFFCYGGCAWVEGIGDRVEVYQSFPKVPFLLINPNFAVATPWVYQQWDLQLTLKDPGATVRPLFQVVSDVVGSLHNDLERVTIPAHPEIGMIKDALMGAGANGALMSGSGPTVFGVFADARTRDVAFENLNDGRWRVFKADSVVD
jgi:4-diphosphocytidyl-2-C-methyl-D-erythritol kinase